MILTLQIIAAFHLLSVVPITIAIVIARIVYKKSLKIEIIHFAIGADATVLLVFGLPTI